MSYRYIDLTEKGYTQVYFTRKMHNKLFPNDKINLFNRYEYFYNDYSLVFHEYTSTIGVIIQVILFPINLLWCGVGNFRELIEEYNNLFNQRKNGKFRSWHITNKERVKSLLEYAKS